MPPTALACAVSALAAATAAVTAPQSAPTRAVSASASAPAPARQPLTLSLFDLARYPTAVCNDGTPSGYYFSPSPSGNSPVWIVHQQGGGWCYDAGSCKARSGDLVSSKGWASTTSPGGIFAPTDPRLADANQVFVPYCSSDAYIGNIGASDVPFGFHFRGRAIVTAVLTELAVTRGLQAAANAQVLYGGCSAGARGALFNNEFVATWLAANTAVTHVGIALDSSFWVDVQPLAAGEPSFAQITQDVLAMVNATAQLSPTCVAGVGGAANAWRCMFGQYATPFVVTSYLLFAWSFDSYQVRATAVGGGHDSSCLVPSHALPSHALPSHALPSHALPSQALPSHALPAHALPSLALPSHALPSHALPSHALPSHACSSSPPRSQLSYDIAATVPTTTQQLAYAQAFHDQLLVAARNDTIAPGKPGTAAMLPACYHHCITESSLFTSMMVNDTTMEQATASWFFNDDSAPRYIVDTCSGFNCGSYCPPLPAGHAMRPH